jgi:hypothetical protein
VLKTDLAYIRANLSFLSQYITNLEMTTNLLPETIKDINDNQDALKKINGSKADAGNKNSTHVLERIKGLKSRVIFHAY